MTKQSSHDDGLLLGTPPTSRGHRLLLEVPEDKRFSDAGGIWSTLDYKTERKEGKDFDTGFKWVSDLRL